MVSDNFLLSGNLEFHDHTIQNSAQLKTYVYKSNDLFIDLKYFFIASMPVDNMVNLKAFLIEAVHHLDYDPELTGKKYSDVENWITTNATIVLKPMPLERVKGLIRNWLCHEESKRLESKLQEWFGNPVYVQPQFDFSNICEAAYWYDEEFLDKTDLSIGEFLFVKNEIVYYVHYIET